MSSGRCVVHVAGARPNFPKLGPVYRALGQLGAEQKLVHTGQHFDDALSGVFFRQLEIPEPDFNLGVGSGSGSQTIARIMLEIEPLLQSLDPACVIVYGDVNSTVAAAMVAVKLGVSVAHVEAGLRSFDRGMPEEINRVVTDQLSEVHFVTSEEALTNLQREGIAGDGVHFVGNPMIDTLLDNLHRFSPDDICARLGIPGDYAVATLHRPSNVDRAADARAVVQVIHEVADQIDLVLPAHPRGRGNLLAAGLDRHERVHVVDPLGYVEFMGLVRGARMVVTDSGGVQEETTIFRVPCLTLRENTERPVTITHGTNRLVKREGLSETARAVLSSRRLDAQVPPLWDGHAGQRIARSLKERYGLD